MRQCNLANSGSGWTQAQRSHVASHYLPNRPLRHRAHMQSRAYIGQFSRHGNLFVGACSSLFLFEYYHGVPPHILSWRWCRSSEEWCTDVAKLMLPGLVKDSF